MPLASRRTLPRDKVDKVPRMRRVTITTLICALIFGLPRDLARSEDDRVLVHAPVPAGAASAFNCTDAVQWAMNKLVVTQVIGISSEWWSESSSES